MKRHVIPALLITSVLAACSSTPVAQSEAPALQPSATAQSSARPPAPSSVAVAPVSASPPTHLDPNSLLGREHSVYFDFDDAIVQREYMPIVERHAQYLLQHPSLSVAVQGNTDEGGGSEYNLALGQRRAQAVKTAMQLLGVKETQVEAVSFGEEKPAVSDHDEAAWRQNRRADIAYRR